MSCSHLLQVPMPNDGPWITGDWETRARLGIEAFLREADESGYDMHEGPHELARHFKAGATITDEREVGLGLIYDESRPGRVWILGENQRDGCSELWADELIQGIDQGGYSYNETSEMVQEIRGWLKTMDDRYERKVNL